MYQSCGPALAYRQDLDIHWVESVFGVGECPFQYKIYPLPYAWASRGNMLVCDNFQACVHRALL